MKVLEEEYIHEKRKKYANEDIENEFVRSYLVTTTAIINSKTPRKPHSEVVVQRCFVKKVFLKISQNSQENTVPESVFNKTACLRPATLLKKRLCHRCFPVNFAKFSRTSFLQKTSGGCFCPLNNRNPTVGKLWWSEIYNNWSDDNFKEKLSEFHLPNIRLGFHFQNMTSLNFCPGFHHAL